MTALKAATYRDSEGIYTAEVYDAPAVKAAKADPTGCRVALMNYGDLLGYPGGAIPPIWTNQGEESWRANIDRATPLMLGIAWLNLEKQLGNSWSETPPTNGQNAPKEEEKEMPVIQWKEASGLALEPGFYRAKVTQIKETTGDFGPQLEFTFTVLDEEGDETDNTVRAWCGIAWSAKAKLFGWSKALLRSKCPIPPAPIDTDVLIGKRCDIELVQGKQRDDGGYWTKLAPTIYPYNTMASKDDSAA